jgi:hypothetical protein
MMLSELDAFMWDDQVKENAFEVLADISIRAAERLIGSRCMESLLRQSLFPNAPSLARKDLLYLQSR